MPVKVVAFVPDLMDRSKFQGLGPDIEVKFASALSSLANAPADLVVADLSRPGVIDVLAHIEGAKVGFFSHIDDETRQAAVAAGVRVYARSAFFSRIVAILTKSDSQVADTSE